MLLPTTGARRLRRRKGSVLVEYALLIAGVALACVVAISVLGQKTADAIGVTAALIPGAHAEDNKPIAQSQMIPLDKSGSAIRLDSSQLVNQQGVDRMQTLLGEGGGELLIQD